VKYLLLTVIVLWICAGYLLKQADRPGDDFGAAIPGLALGTVASVGIVYVALVFWNHRFL
jgi:hypothetical protein